MPDDKLPIPQFAAKIKAKYPQYKDVNDTVLVQRIVEKYPEYAESVDMSALTPKKKETGGGLSSIGARVGVPASKAQSLSGRSLSQGIESVGEVEYEPEDDKTRLRQIVGFKKNERPFDQTKEDAVKGAANRLGEIMYGEGDEWKDPIKATMNGLKSAKSTKDALDFYGAKNLTEDALMPNGFEAKRILGSTIFGQAGADNMTANALKKKANTYEKVVSPFRGINPQELTYLTKDRVYDAAIRSYANQNEHFKKQLEAAGVDLSKNDLGLSLGDSDAKRGEIMQVVLNNPDVMTFLQNEKPELIPLMKDVQENLIYDNKDFGKVQLANEISRDMQKGGYNKIDPVFNLENNAKEAGDATAELLYANDPKKLQFYRENKDAILSKLDAPSLFSSFAEAGEGFGSGILNTFTEPFTPASKTIKENWEKEARHVSSNPTGFVKFLSDSGHALGFVASIGATGNVLGASGILNPKTSGAVATAIGFLGDQLEQGRMKYPDSPIKAYTSALFNTGLYTALSFQLFPAAKVEQAFTAVKPGISNIVENLASGNITREVAKAQMNTLGKRALEIAGEGLSKNVKVSAEMTGITMLNKALDKAMGMDKDTFRQFHPEGEEADTAKSMFLSNIIVNGLAAYGQVKAKNNLAKNAIYEAASFPNRYRNIIESSEIRMKVAETKDMLDNLDYVSNLKRELDNRGLTERQKKDYIYNALQSKVLNAAKPASPEAALTRKSEYRLKDLEEINAGILEGKDADEVITTNEQKIIDENKKYEDNLSKIDKELETLTSNKELDNKEIDLKIQNLEKKDNPLYEIQKQKLEQQRKENNDYYDSSIEKLNKEKGDLLIKRGRNDEQFLKDQALDAPNALKSQLGGEKEVVEVIAKSTIPEIEEAIKKWEDRLKKDDVTEEEADRHISLLEKGIELVKEREKLAEIYQQRELDNGMTPPEGKETPTPTEENVGTVSEGVLKEISDKDAENVFNKLLEDEYGTDEYGIEGLLYDWGGVEYNKDSGELSFEDTRSGTGNLSSTKKEFIDDILSGKIEKEIPAIREYVQKLKELILKEIGEEKPSTVTEQHTKPQPTKEEATTQEQVIKKEEAPPSDSTPRGQDGEPPVGDGVGKIGEGEGGGDVKPSGIRKALVSEEIVKGVDLEKVGDKEMMAMGRKIIDSGDVKPKELVEKIVSEKTGVLTPAEVVALITYKADIDNKLRDIYTEINEKQANGEDIGTLGVEAKNLEVEKRNFDIAAVITANQQSMAFRLRQWMLDPEYNATTEIEKYKKNNFGEIPDEIKKKFEDLEKQITDLRSKIREAQEKKDKQEAENAINDILEDIERERKRNGGLTEEEVQERIEKGVQEEIDAIYKKLPKDKKSIADKAIDALQKLEDKLKGKTYADPTGVVAAIRIGISTIKNAIKAGVAVADAIEIGIEKIREYVKKNGITSFDENDFRKEAIDTFEASGVSTKNKDDDKPVLNDDGTVTIPNKMIRNIVSKGVTDVDAVVNEVQKEVEKILPGVTKRQVRDYITGYGKKTNPTKDAVQQEINELKRVGKLLSELEDVQAGIRKTTDKQKRQALSQRERDLRRQIKALNKEIPFTEEELQSQEESRLSAAKTRTKSRIEELIDRLKNKNFATKKPIPVKADAELNDLLKQKEALQEEYEIEHKKNEIKNRTWWQKVEDIALEIFSGIPRAIVAGADLSAMFVQGTRHFFTRPIDSFKAFGESLRQFVSDKRQQEWLDRLKSSKAYPLIRASKLAISDKDGKLSAKEQIFIINWLNQIYDIGATILGLGQRPMVDFFKRLNPFKASQRAFDGYLNYIRVSKFLKIAKKLEYDGYNFESNPKEFTELGDWVNTVTGRARLGSMESSSKWLSIAMFAPRKVAAELKLYTPYAFLYYAKMPKKVRAEALKELAFFASSFLVTNSLLKAALGNWDDDDDFWNPDSSNFLTHKIGSTNVGFGGGAKSTLVMLSRLFGKRYTDQYGRDSKLGERFGKKINTKWDVIRVFLEGKASPGASLILKKLDEKKGLENDDMEYLKSVTMPMWMQDLGDLYRKNPEEVGAILTLLSLIGANVRVVDEPKKPSKPSRPKRERPKIDRPNR